jgi:hypothetical protein
MQKVLKSIGAPLLFYPRSIVPSPALRIFLRALPDWCR